MAHEIDAGSIFGAMSTEADRRALKVICKLATEYDAEPGTHVPRSCPRCQFGPCKDGYEQVKLKANGYVILNPDGVPEHRKSQHWKHKGIPAEVIAAQAKMTANTLGAEPKETLAQTIEQSAELHGPTNCNVARELNKQPLHWPCMRCNKQTAVGNCLFYDYKGHPAFPDEIRWHVKSHLRRDREEPANRQIFTRVQRAKLMTVIEGHITHKTNDEALAAIVADIEKEIATWKE